MQKQLLLYRIGTAAYLSFSSFIFPFPLGKNKAAGLNGKFGHGLTSVRLPGNDMAYFGGKTAGSHLVIDEKN